jgi:hypothetical protein
LFKMLNIYFGFYNKKALHLNRGLFYIVIYSSFFLPYLKDCGMF